MTNSYKSSIISLYSSRYSSRYSSDMPLCGKRLLQRRRERARLPALGGGQDSEAAINFSAAPQRPGGRGTYPTAWWHRQLGTGRRPPSGSLRREPVDAPECSVVWVIPRVTVAARHDCATTRGQPPRLLRRLRPPWRRSRRIRLIGRQPVWRHRSVWRSRAISPEIERFRQVRGEIAPNSRPHLSAALQVERSSFTLNTVTL